MSHNIHDLARIAYDEGISPIEYAVHLACTQIEVQVEILISRLDNPAAYPSYQLPLHDDAVARRIIGELFNAGWTPPADKSAQ